jgi:hypothetical protein
MEGEISSREEAYRYFESTDEGKRYIDIISQFAFLYSGTLAKEIDISLMLNQVKVVYKVKPELDDDYVLTLARNNYVNKTREKLFQYVGNDQEGRDEMREALGSRMPTRKNIGDKCQYLGIILIDALVQERLSMRRGSSPERR